MKQIVFGFILLASTAGIFDAAIAGDLKLSGQMSQGGLILGWASPGATITLDGKKIRQAASGDFLLGFSRDAKAKAKLEIKYADGTQDMRALSITPRSYDIQRIDGLPKRKVTPSAADLVRIKKERALITKARQQIVTEPMFVAGFTRPVIGRISGVYGSQRILNGKPRRPHYGVDIAAPEGSNIKAASAGVVIFAHPGMFFNGKTVIIDHGLGLRSTYIHMSALAVKAGQQVNKGQIVGRVGQTGRATGSHLHWGLQLNSLALDPELLPGILLR